MSIKHQNSGVKIFALAFQAAFNLPCHGRCVLLILKILLSRPGAEGWQKTEKYRLHK